jgi:opacity protein-like surface antigen
MSITPKLQTALSVVFILTTAGAISVAAQTQNVAENSPVVAVAKAPSTTDAKKTNVTEVSAVASVSPAVVKTAEVTPETAGTTSTAKANSPVPPTPAPASTDEWQYQLTPYAWIAGISGTARIGNLTAEVSSGVTDTSVHINFAFMGAFEAHKDKLTVLVDLQFSNLGTNKATPGPGFSAVKTTTKTFVLDPEVGYRFAENKEKGRFVELVGGMRYWHLNEQLDFTAGILSARSASASRDWVDGVVGLRGKAALSKKWFVTGKMDLGGGGSKFTYQLLGGVGVMVSKKIALVGGYRDIYVNKTSDDFQFKMSLHGPIIGLGFKF